MFQTAGQVVGDTARESGVTALSLSRVAARQFPKGTTAMTDFVSRAFLPVQSAAAGVTFHPDVLLHGTGNTFSDMVPAILKALLPAAAFVADQPHGTCVPTDMVLLGHAAPDMTPNEITGTFVASLLCGEPLAYAITDQGSAGVFTALRLAEQYAQRRSCDRAVVLAFDQATFPYDPDVAATERLHGDAGVGMLLERDGDGAVQVLQRAGLVHAEAEAVELAVEGLLERLRVHPRASLTVSAGLTASGAFGHSIRVTRRAPLGFPSTSLVAMLARLGPSQLDEPAVLIDYDPVHGQLSVCRIDGPLGAV